MFYRYLLIFCFGFLYCNAQQDTLQPFYKTNISKPDILSTHSFGVFTSRLQGHFEMTAQKKSSVFIGLKSGNVWSPPLLVYIPKNEADRVRVRTYNWDQAHRAFDENTIEKDSFYIANDGVTKGFNLNFNIFLAKKHELIIDFRTHLLTSGKSIFSILTSDEFIEKFHEKIAGGNDPFDRKVFGFNKATINYVDRNSNSMTINNGDFFATGIKTSYYYYPELFKRLSQTFKVNFGAHLGANLSKYNSALDLGLSTNAIKLYKLNTSSQINVGLSVGVLRKNIIDFKSTNLDFGTNAFIANLESSLEYSFKTKQDVIHAFGANFYLQSSLNKKEELDYIIPIRHPNAFKSWGQGALNLYKNINYWSFIYSFSKKNTTYFYVQQDLTLNNNPDIQTGVGYKFSL